MTASQVEREEWIRNIQNRTAIPEKNLLRTSEVLLMRKFGKSPEDHLRSAMLKIEPSLSETAIFHPLVQLALAGSLDVKPAIYKRLHDLADNLKKGNKSLSIEEELRQVSLADEQLRRQTPQEDDETFHAYTDRIHVLAIRQVFGGK